jgi:hypothetical protein
MGKQTRLLMTEAPAAATAKKLPDGGSLRPLSPAQIKL